MLTSSVLLSVRNRSGEDDSRVKDVTIVCAGVGGGRVKGKGEREIPRV